MPAGPRLAAFLCAVFAAAGLSSAFLPLWMADRGLAPAQIGTALALASAARVVMAPLWGRLADAVAAPRAMAAAAAVALGGSLLLAPAHGFGWILLAAMVQAAGSCALMPLGDALSLALARQGRLDYGRVRAAASAAFMAAAGLGGPLLGAVGIAVLPLLTALGHAGAAASAMGLPAAGSAAARGGLLAAGLGLLRNRVFLLTVLASAAIQGSHAAYYTLGALHWRAAGYSETVIGLLWGESLLAEILLFLAARRVVARMSPALLTALAALACALRWLVLGASTALPALVAIQLLHACTFGFQHLAAMLVLGRAIPPERAASAQTLHAALGGTVSLGAITFLAGRFYDGGGGVFWAMAALALVALPVAAALVDSGRRAGAA